MSLVFYSFVVITEKLIPKPKTSPSGSAFVSAHHPLAHATPRAIHRLGDTCVLQTVSFLGLCFFPPCRPSQSSPLNLKCYNPSACFSSGTIQGDKAELSQMNIRHLRRKIAFLPLYKTSCVSPCTTRFQAKGTETWPLERSNSQQLGNDPSTDSQRRKERHH